MSVELSGKSRIFVPMKTAVRNFDDLMSRLEVRERRRVAVVWPDSVTEQACRVALDRGLADFVLVGPGEDLDAVALDSRYEIEPVADPDTAARRAVQLVREGRAQVIMKGHINTDNLLRAVLDRENGLRREGGILTHVTVAQVPTYDRLLCFTDPAVIPYPTHEQRVAQVRAIVEVCHGLGIAEPSVALVHCSEKVDERHFPHTAGYRDIVAMSREGAFGPCIVDGPLDLKTACCREALEAKGLDSPLEGRADALVLPDIEAANVLYKALTLFAGACTAGLMVGARAPLVVSSRGDTPESKFSSSAVATLIASSSSGK